MAKKSLYEILGVPRDAMDLDIGLAHANRLKELQRASPPDPGAQVLLHQAYETLSDARRRAAYDASLVTAAEKAAAAEQAEPTSCSRAMRRRPIRRRSTSAPRSASWLRSS